MEPKENDEDTEPSIDVEEEDDSDERTLSNSVLVNEEAPQLILSKLKTNIVMQASLSLAFVPHFNPPSCLFPTTKSFQSPYTLL